MIRNPVVVASTADCLANLICEKLHNIDFRGYIASNDKDLFFNINNYYPKYIFIENCFHNDVTDEYVYKIKRNNENLRIVIWTASDIQPFLAARFINAGAESFFSLRDKDQNVNSILKQIVLGQIYCPDDVAKACNIHTTNPIFDIPFSNRELKIMRLLRLKDIEIAEKLQITYGTVCYHKSNVFKKLGMKNRFEVIEYAIKHSIITPEKKINKEKL